MTAGTRWWLGGILLCLVACGDREPVPGPPARCVVVISDGLHSSLLVPGPVLTDDLAWRWIELGFSDRAWTVDGDQNWRHALRLGVFPDQGVVEVAAISDLASSLAAADRFVTVPISTAGHRALTERLAFWLDPDQAPIALVDGRSYLASRRSFSAYNSCNDFVADLLVSAGVDLPARPARSQGRLCRTVASWVRRQGYRPDMVPVAPLLP